MIEIDGHRYEIVIATDTSGPFEHNRAIIEMSSLDGPVSGPFLIASRSNATGKITISMYQQDVPIEVLSYFLRLASKELSVDHWPLWEDPEQKC